MASIHALKRRMQASRNVSKTTRAMQMISASKLKKAQQAAVSARPYVEKLTQISQNISTQTNTDLPHPYLEQRIGKTLLIAISPDKGLCGGLITNLFKEFFTFRETEKDTIFLTVGKKIEGQVVHLKNEVLASFVFGTTLPLLSSIYPVTRIIDDYYLSGKVASVKILSTHFTSIFTQTPKIVDLLPIKLPSDPGQKNDTRIFEPSITELLPALLKKYIEMTVYQYFLESFVSEQASRMIAMQNATNNANDIIEDLRLEYNKTRQAKITSEILDISGGLQ